VRVLSGIQATVRAMADELGNATFSGYTGLISPYTLVDGIVSGAFGASSTIGQGPPGGLGTAVFVVVTLVLVVGSYAALVIRYRKALT
jgi:ABC-2 type transport system permease protein